MKITISKWMDLDKAVGDYNIRVYENVTGCLIRLFNSNIMAADIIVKSNTKEKVIEILKPFGFEVEFGAPIKPCPFCGAEGDIWMTGPATLPADKSKCTWVADCSQCDCVIGEKFKTKQEAISEWNRRVEQCPKN